MRKLFVLLVSSLLLFGIFASPAISRPRPRRGRAPVKAAKVQKNRKERIRDLKLIVSELERKLTIASAEQETRRVRNKLKTIRAELQTLVGEEAPVAAPPLNIAPAAPASPRAMPGNKAGMRPRHLPPQIGISGGYIAGIPGIVSEIRFHNPLEMISTTLRIGAGYAQGADTAGTIRKHTLIIIDGIYRLNPPNAKGIRNYFGFGMNYDAYTSGQVAGTFGGQAFYGIEGNAGPGAQIFAEVGYGVIRTGFSPNQTGISAQLGYKF